MLALGVSPATDDADTDVNPFFADYGTPFNVQPFDRIDEAHFVPAFEEANRVNAYAVYLSMTNETLQ